MVSNDFRKEITHNSVAEYIVGSTKCSRQFWRHWQNDLGESSQTDSPEDTNLPQASTSAQRRKCMVSLVVASVDGA